jgi:CheY-like chemotaxis protein
MKTGEAASQPLVVPLPERIILDVMLSRMAGCAAFVRIKQAGGAFP